MKRTIDPLLIARAEKNINALTLLQASWNKLSMAQQDRLRKDSEVVKSQKTEPSSHNDGKDGSLTIDQAKELFENYLFVACPECEAPVGQLCEINRAVWIHASRYVETERSPHSRACGPFCRGHGSEECSTDCPTCQGKSLKELS